VKANPVNPVKANPVPVKAPYGFSEGLSAEER